MNNQRYLCKYIRPRLWMLYGLVVVALSCAKEMTPTGGPKDTTPPKLRKASPPNFSTNIQPKKITLTFDEFLVVKNPQQQVIISPPIKSPLSINPKGKSIVVEIKDSLKPNTTYNINFFDVIRDFTEGNIAHDFQYIFSTGPNIDTLFISGTIVDAFSGNPVENVQVGIYEDLSDSVVVNNLPTYWTRTNKEGSFVIKNIKSDNYKIFALLDIDNNMLYNLPNEALAFSTDTLHLKHIDPISGDTIHQDSIVTHKIATSSIQDITLRLFIPLYEKQFVKKVVRHRRNALTIYFNRATAIDPMLNDFSGNQYPKSPFSNADSVIFFVPTKELANADTLHLALNYIDLDSTRNLKTFHDTIHATIAPFKTYALDTLLTFSSNVPNNKLLDVDKKFVLMFSNPVIKYEFDKISVFTSEDTVFSKINSVFAIDSTLFFASLDNKLLPDLKYRITIDSAAFTDIYGNVSLPHTIEFQTPPESAYGVLAINLLFEYPEETVFELTDKESKKVFWREKPRNAKTLTIKYLKPGTYGLRMFHDKNRNNRQDTGDYFLKLSPEHTIRYQKDISVRANWDTEITWEIR